MLKCDFQIYIFKKHILKLLFFNSSYFKTANPTDTFYLQSSSLIILEEASLECLRGVYQASDSSKSSSICTLTTFITIIIIIINR